MGIVAWDFITSQCLPARPLASRPGGGQPPTKSMPWPFVSESWWIEKSRQLLRCSLSTSCLRLLTRLSQRSAVASWMRNWPLLQASSIRRRRRRSPAIIGADCRARGERGARGAPLFACLWGVTLPLHVNWSRRHRVGKGGCQPTSN